MTLVDTFQKRRSGRSGRVVVPTSPPVPSWPSPCGPQSPRPNAVVGGGDRGVSGLSRGMSHPRLAPFTHFFIPFFDKKKEKKKKKNDYYCVSSFCFPHEYNVFAPKGRLPLGALLSFCGSSFFSFSLPTCLCELLLVLVAELKWWPCVWGQWLRVNLKGLGPGCQ